MYGNFISMTLELGFEISIKRNHMYIDIDYIIFWSNHFK